MKTAATWPGRPRWSPMALASRVRIWRRLARPVSGSWAGAMAKSGRLVTASVTSWVMMPMCPPTADDVVVLNDHGGPVDAMASRRGRCDRSHPARCRPGAGRADVESASNCCGTWSSSERSTPRDVDPDERSSIEPAPSSDRACWLAASGVPSSASITNDDPSASSRPATGCGNVERAGTRLYVERRSDGGRNGSAPK